MIDNNLPIEATLLGKRTEYPKQYAPEILVAVPRRLNREQYNIQDDNLPFVGGDAWHAYELSWLNHRGMPSAGLLKIVYPASSPCIIESKSLKLYLNSLNMHRTAESNDNGKAEIISLVSHDLSSAIGAPVSISIHNHDAYHNAVDPFKDYSVLESLPECQEIETDIYQEDPNILLSDIQKSNPNNAIHISSHLLRSNCKITHQPDWGSIFIHFKPAKDGSMPSLASLLKYIISLRGENHFHEEICEMVYTRLHSLFHPSELCVTCIYTRRGGIDICPSRASSEALLPTQLLRSETIIQKLARQ
ncbi:MAG: NADPH-dependent 7-cyano-7-deazaguanine reductase QueF [Bacteroidia bacterium]|nr:NADPH-dependent 7-cyano-7-deazaguanine reductase QueF [Bacteroidia bacterium]